VAATLRDALRVLDTWLDVVLFDGDEALLAAGFPGVELR